jgi:hypothetical protein
MLAIATSAEAAGHPTYLVGTSNGSTLQFAMNSKVVARTKLAAPGNVTSTPVEIGSFLSGEVFFGTIDEVALYDRPLSAEDIARHYAAGTGASDYARTVKSTPGLVAYWRLDDPTAARANDVLGKHPGTYRPGTALRVPGLLAHDPNRAAAFDGAAGDVIVDHATDLSLPRGFTIEAWAAPGGVRDQAVVSKANSWFMKSDPQGRWGVGVFSGPKIASIYGKERSKASPAPIAQATPPPSKASKPQSIRKGKNHKDSGSNIALILWVLIIAVAVAGWLFLRGRRRAAADGEHGDPDDEPSDESDDVEDGKPEPRDPTRMGS